ncbi:hypothetical protein MACH09_33750 [Vibrio sp. MACH09]|uniref:putative bifunctional diguanylate cyclase/phosphodiesterase n=1 Tax=Vibrio sp. MACH09 TaxID=3025122 RepID=UPI00278CDF65|nr:EAL domain-containing protein [Vibrio sp. MACH09]GLO62867.1 hypothetical protein MACH09_33750 [Vibrio sp. MACH09]
MKNDKELLEQDERRFIQLIGSLSKVAVQGYSVDREVIYWNAASTQLYGYSQQEALGKRLEELIIPEPMRDAVVGFHTDWVTNGNAIPAAELKLLHKDGYLVPVFSMHIMLKEWTDVPEMFCIDIDMTEQHKAVTELERLAISDTLTKLPNRRFLEEELERRITEAKRFEQKVAVLFIDLDLFKEVNDTMGHAFGDQLLIQVSDRLRNKLRKYDTLSRFGGDEFVVILPNIGDKADVEAAANKLLNQFTKSFLVAEQNIYSSASIGISIFPDDATTTERLLQHSDTAMYQAKMAGRNRFLFFNKEMNDRMLFEREVANQLKESLVAGGFELVYQPKVDLLNNKVTACEALLRWHRSPTLESASPAVFIPIAERSDLIILIGNWVLKEACRQLSVWRKQGYRQIKVDINVSSKQLVNSDFFDLFYETLEFFDLSEKDIGIEITEHTLLKANDELLARLNELRARGTEISIDDFGTGYSSLSYLTTFPATHLKIDRSFISGPANSRENRIIIEAITDVGKKLNFQMVAEGIETLDQARFCEQLGCEIAQGYWFYRPLNAGDMTDLLQN